MPLSASKEQIPALTEILASDEWLQWLSSVHKIRSSAVVPDAAKLPALPAGGERLKALLIAPGFFKEERGTWKPTKSGEELIYRVNELLHLRRLEGTGNLPTDAWRESQRGGVVEIGCGTGHCLLCLARMGFHPLFGYDLSPMALDMTRSLLANEKFTASLFAEDATRLEKIADHSLSLVYSRGAFHYFHLPTLAESVNRVLVPGGRVVVEVKAPGYYLQLFNDLRRLQVRRAASYARTYFRSIIFAASGFQPYLGGRSPEMGWSPNTVRQFARQARLKLDQLRYVATSKSQFFVLSKGQ